MASVAENSVRVEAGDYGRWNWVRHTHEGALDGVSRQSYATELEAALAAATVARTSGLRLQVPDDLRAQLEAKWEADGRAYYRMGWPLDDCVNRYQRQGWVAAEAQEMEDWWEATVGRPADPDLSDEEAEIYYHLLAQEEA